MSEKSHYPSYDVMKEYHEWDNHTQKIVSSRVMQEKPYIFLTVREIEMLRSICSLMVDDVRGDVIQYVLDHMDQTLSKTIGESERKPNVPKAQVLIRGGLDILDQASMQRYSKYYIGLDKTIQKQLLQELSEYKAQPFSIWKDLNQLAFFKKLLNMTLDGYYSHPAIWSEIGYGGPAYPRGYIRTQKGQLDPWEAQPET